LTPWKEDTVNRRQLLKTVAVGAAAGLLPASVAATPRRPSLWEFDFVASGAAYDWNTPAKDVTTKLGVTFRTADGQRWWLGEMAFLRPDGRLDRRSWDWATAKAKHQLRYTVEDRGVTPAATPQWLVKTGADEFTAVDVAAGVFLDDVVDSRGWSKQKQRYLP
jgi:hypothetical protein